MKCHGYGPWSSASLYCLSEALQGIARVSSRRLLILGTGVTLLLLSVLLPRLAGAEESTVLDPLSLETPSELSECLKAFGAEVLQEPAWTEKALLEANLPSLDGPMTVSMSHYGYVHALQVLDGEFLLPPASTIEEQAVAFLEEWSCLTGVETKAGWSLVADQGKEGPDGDVVLVFHQSYGTLPLFGSEILLWVSSDGALRGLLNRTVPTDVLDGVELSPELAGAALAMSSQEAGPSAIGMYHASYYHPGCGEECLYSAPVPAFRTMATAQEGKAWSFVSPVDGAILGSVSVDRNDSPTKYGCGYCRELGLLPPDVCASNDQDCSECSGCTDGFCMQVCGACNLVNELSQFLSAGLGRDSWDDGKAPQGLVPECECSNNAAPSHELAIVSDLGGPGNSCISCDASTFGAETLPIPDCSGVPWVCGIALGRYRSCLDAAAHELGHLMNYAERRINLNAAESYHSGAIEEGFCDVLGEGAESWASGTGADWLHGTGGTCVPNRNLVSPQDSYTFGSDGGCGDLTEVVLPEHVSMYNSSGGSGWDKEYFNATIIGKLGYLLARPSTAAPINYWGVDVYGVGETCVREAFYSAFKHTLMPADPTYSDLWNPILSAFLTECGSIGYVRAYYALAALGFWTNASAMSWASEFAISTEYYPAHAAHPYWLFMNIGGSLIAFGRECRLSQSCSYTVQNLGQTARGVSTVIYNNELHVFANTECKVIKHWKIGSDGVVVALASLPAATDRTPSAILKNGTMYVVYRACTTTQVSFARFIPATNTWTFSSFPFTTPGAPGAVVTEVYTYIFLPDDNSDLQYYAWANTVDSSWVGPSSCFPGTAYREMAGEEPPGVEWYKNRIHLSYPNSRTDGRSTVYGSCTWPCWQTDAWTAITPLDDEDRESLWVYLDGTSQNDGGLYQLRGWELPSSLQNVTRRWKASE